jgi:hypothetical protein
MSRLGERQERAEERAADSDGLDRLARVGVITYGAMHLVVAWLVVRLALGDHSGSASGGGALRQLAQGTAGRGLLVVVAAGFLALGLWQAVEAVLGYRGQSGRQRLVNRILSALKAVTFGVIGVNAFLVAAGSSGGGGSPDGVTARLMAAPAGPLVVGLVGVVVIVVALFLAYHGLSEGFRDTLSDDGATGTNGRWYVRLGTVGYVSKGVAIALVGSLFVYAAVTHDPEKSGGLDQALQTVQRETFGAPVLVLVALGLTCFGLFCFALARHLDR